MTETKVPEIRFSGFDEDWRHTTVGETTSIGNGRDYKHLSSGSIPVYGTGGYMLSVDEALSYSRDAIGIGRKGTIDNPFILKAPFWTVDTLFYVIPNKYIDLYFLQGQFERVNWKSKDESTGVPSLSKDTISQVRIKVPSTKEQRQIGYFFAELDDTITAHRKKLDKLQQTKTSLLQKMFPQGDATEPELRLEGFSGTWTKSELGAISNLYQPKTISREGFTCMGVPVFGANGYIGYYTEANHIDDQVTISARGENVGTPSYVTGPVWITGNSMVVAVDTSMYSKRFLFAHFQRYSLIKWRTGGAQPQLTRQNLFSVPILYPSAREQRAIGECFSQLDGLIEAERLYVEKLRQVKAALLRKMFV